MRDASYGKKRNLAAGWVDFAKAFDSIPHGYIKYILSVLKIHPHLRGAISNMMRGWSVRYVIGCGKDKSVSTPLKVRRGVLQGDTLSPLLFCIAIAPVSYALNTKFRPYRTTGLAINHLFYMDDLKVYASTLADVKSMIGTVEIEAAAMGLRLNRNKCALVSSTAALP